MEELENPQGQTQDIRTYIQVRKKFWKNTKLSERKGWPQLKEYLLIIAK